MARRYLDERPVPHNPALLRCHWTPSRTTAERPARHGHGAYGRRTPTMSAILSAERPTPGRQHRQSSTHTPILARWRPRRSPMVRPSPTPTTRRTGLCPSPPPRRQTARVLNVYDHRHRRIRKVVQRLTLSVSQPPAPPIETREWQSIATHTFVWDGNLLLHENSTVMLFFVLFHKVFL